MAQYRKNELKRKELLDLQSVLSKLLWKVV